MVWIISVGEKFGGFDFFGKTRPSWSFRLSFLTLLLLDHDPSFAICPKIIFRGAPLRTEIFFGILEFSIKFPSFCLAVLEKFTIEF